MSGWGHNTIGRSPALNLVRMVLAVAVMLWLLRAGLVPFVIMVFFVGPWLFRSMAQFTTNSCGDSKRKHEQAPKRKHNRPERPAEYIETPDGEFLEVVDDRPTRRQHDLF